MGMGSTKTWHGIPDIRVRAVSNAWLNVISLDSSDEDTEDSSEDSVTLDEELPSGDQC